jgi:hypothetical protein
MSTNIPLFRTITRSLVRPVARPSRFLPSIHLATRASSSSSSSRSSFSRPGPPPLSPSDQAEFDALIKANASIGATPAAAAPKAELEQAEEQHRDLRKGPKPEFQGDVNPKTGERGGPKVDPFKAGDNDWSYGGRVTVSRMVSRLNCLFSIAHAGYRTSRAVQLVTLLAHLHTLSPLHTDAP